MESGELRELHELQYVGRVQYETLDLHKMLEKFVRHGGYSIIDASLTLDLAIAEDFLKTSESREARRRIPVHLSICPISVYLKVRESG